MTRTSPRPISVGLSLKVTVLLLLIGLAPLLVSALLIDKMSQAAQNFASNEAARLRVRLEEAHGAYRTAVETKKRSYGYLADEMADAVRVAVDRWARPSPPAGYPEGAAADLDRVAARLLAAEPDLLGVEVAVPGLDRFQTSRPAPGTGGPTRFRIREVARDVAGGRVALQFAADEDLQKASERLGLTLAEAPVIGEFRAGLPDYYRNLFLMLVGGVVLVATAGGIFLARRFTARIARLVAGTRTVAAGDLGARVQVGGRDELTELAGAFNRMVEDVERDRQHILYLQRIGAWQDVARRLAHEIKNPLTPIQLAVQELLSSYQGDDARHKKMLADTAEIVGEEIASLRRLVDAFSALGRLPPAEPKPLDLAVVADDLGKDPQWSGKLAVEPPAAPVTVSGDRLLLRRLLANLVENGVHAGERVVLSWRADPAAGVARVTIDDQGPGVLDKERERIFEPYVTSKETGTGLGLAIAKKIALDHRGDLSVSPERAPTGGARFILSVPLADTKP
ncbi:MAG TPA: ATP-binding protein [Kofleriaceae bacterium]|jgi:signal transduction histidine kinase